MARAAAIVAATLIRGVLEAEVELDDPKSSSFSKGSLNLDIQFWSVRRLLHPRLQSDQRPLHQELHEAWFEHFPHLIVVQYL